MKIPQDERFRMERDRHGLRFTCEDCAMWDPDRDACAHGYPTREHRRERYDDEASAVVFCKDWDLR